MNSRTRASGVRGVTHSSSLRGEPCTNRVGPSPSTSATTWLSKPFTNRRPAAPCCAAIHWPRSLWFMPTSRSAFPRTNRVGVSIERTTSSVCCGSGPHVRSPQKTIRSTCSCARSASTARKAGAFACTSASAATRNAPVLGAAGDRELVLGVPEALLDLPAVGARLAAIDRFELLLGLLELRACGGLVDLVRLHSRIDERDRPVLQHLEEPGSRRVLEHLVPVEVNPRRPRLERRDQRRVPREHADLPRGARDDDHLRVTLVGGAVRRHQRDGELAAVGH